ncbi:MAG: Mur ligase domain-containing protein [Phycisphaeraceae bacterium]
MSFWSYHNLARVTEGEWLVEPADLNAQVAGLWHDTREIKPGQAYLAIKGDNFDGHDFVDQAFDAGASLAIVSDSNLKRVAGVELASPRNELRSTIGQSDRSGGRRASTPATHRSFSCKTRSKPYRTSPTPTAAS